MRRRQRLIMIAGLLCLAGMSQPRRGRRITGVAPSPRHRSPASASTGGAHDWRRQWRTDKGGRHQESEDIMRGLILVAGLLCTLTASTLSSAAEEVTERAVPGSSSTLREPALPPRATIPALTVEQQLTALQQQVQSLQAQVAALQSALKVTPTGVILQAPTVSILSAEGTTLQSGKGIALNAGMNIALQAQNSVAIKASGSAHMETSGIMELKGALLKFNGGTKPMATVGSQIQISGQPIGQVISGNPTILGN